MQFSSISIIKILNKMKLFIKYTFSILTLCLSYSINAQQTITGIITDKTTKEALSAATVSVLKTGKGSVTDRNGRFELNLPDGADTIVVSYIGYQPKYINSKEIKGELAISLEASTFNLNQVMVTANRDQQLRKEAPIAISQISAKEIAETKPYQLDQVLNRVPSVNMIDLGNEQHAMSIRQPIATNGVFLYLEDGIPIRPTGAFNHNALIEINHASMQRIEVVRGPVSSLYGAEAVGGAINFFNKNPTAKSTGRVAVQGNNLGFRRTDIEGSTTMNKLSVYGVASYSGRRNGFRDNSEYDKLSLYGKAVYTFGAKTKLSAGFTYINYSTDALVGADSANFFNREFPSQYKFAGRDVYALRANTQLNHKWNKNNTTNFTLYFRDNFVDQNATHTIKNNPNDPLRGSSEISRLAFTSYGTQVRNKTDFDWFNSNLILGGSFDYSPTDIVLNYIDVTRNANGDYVGFTNPDSLLGNSQTDVFNSAAYFQYSINPTEKLKVLLSGRYDNIRYEYDNFLDTTASSGSPDGTNEFNAFTPKVGIVYDINPKAGFYANYSRGFLPPQISDLYRETKIPTLEAADYDNYEIGGWYQFGSKATLEVNVYRLEGNNEIVRVDLPDGSRERQNARKTVHQGVEYSLTVKPSEQWKIQLTGSNAIHKYEEHEVEGSEFDDNEIPQAPNWLANSVVTYYPKQVKDLSLSIEWRHVGEYFLDNVNENTYEGYDIFNFRAGYRINAFEIWGSIMNFTDELYSVNTTMRGNDRSYRVGEIRSFNAGIAYNFK